MREADRSSEGRRNVLYLGPVLFCFFFFTSWSTLDQSVYFFINLHIPLASGLAFLYGMKQTAKQQETLSANNDLVPFQLNSNRSVFVRDLPFACTSNVLKEYFIEKLSVPVEKALVCENRKGRNLQFGCVLFEKEEHVQLAIDTLNNSRFQGRDIR